MAGNLPFLPAMRNDRGAALILALIVLFLLSALGGALLTSVTIDARLGDNFITATQLLYLAEAGIEDGLELLSRSEQAPAQLLLMAAGPDGMLASSRRLETLLAGDDEPLHTMLEAADRLAGKTLIDPSGRVAGRYYVFLRDAMGTAAQPPAAQAPMTLLSVAAIDRWTKVVEATVVRSGLPPLPAALTLAGPLAGFEPGATDSVDSMISGIDPGGDSVAAIGVVSTAALDTVRAAIPETSAANYPGGASPNPPPADVRDVNDGLGLAFGTPAGAERLVQTIAAAADANLTPSWGEAAVIGNVGDASNYAVVVAHGDCRLGPGSGYGLLVVRGDLILGGNFRWDGVILVIGQGTVTVEPGAFGEIAGGVLVARSRDAERSGIAPLGNVLADAGPVFVSLAGGTVGIRYSGGSIEKVQARFPYRAIAYREY